MRTRGSLLFVVLLLTGCITVSSFGAYWNSGFVDKELVGHWNSARADKGGGGVDFIPDGGLYRMRFEKTPEDKFTRTLKINSSTFLMTKKHEDDEGGMLIAYVLQGDSLTFFAPNRDKQKDFLKRYPHSPFVITKTSFSIQELNPDTIQWLEKITAESEWWVEIQRFTHEK